MGHSPNELSEVRQRNNQIQYSTSRASEKNKLHVYAQEPLSAGQ